MDKKVFTVTGQGIVLMIFGIGIGFILALALEYLGAIQHNRKEKNMSKRIIDLTVIDVLIILARIFVVLFIFALVVSLTE